MSLRKIVKETTGQDVYHCRGCNTCSLPNASELDVPLGSLLQMVMMDDDEVLSTRTLWSEAALEASRHACHKGLNLQAILLSLRQEAQRRAANS